MKYRLSQFRDFLRTPFPYLILAISIFMASTLLSNTGFKNALRGQNPERPGADRYELCLVCSGPGAKDALSDIGFTAANFVLFPVTFIAFGAISFLTEVTVVGTVSMYAVYLGVTAVYGVLLPFFIFVGYEALAGKLPSREGIPSVYSG